MVDLTEEAWARVRTSRSFVDKLLEKNQVLPRTFQSVLLISFKVVYGINTGFGNFADVTISPTSLRELQENLIRSHAAGHFLVLS